MTGVISEPKQWQLRMEGRGQSQKKEGTEEGEWVGEPQDMIFVVSTLRMRYSGVIQAERPIRCKHDGVIRGSSTTIPK